MANHVAKRPEPVWNKAQLLAALATALGLLETLGVVTTDVGDQISTVAQALIGAGFVVVPAVLLLIHGRTARKDVTPLAAPVTGDGVPLVPVVSESQTASPADDVTAEVNAALTRSQEA